MCNIGMSRIRRHRGLRFCAIHLIRFFGSHGDTTHGSAFAPCTLAHSVYIVFRIIVCLERMCGKAPFAHYLLSRCYSFIETSHGVH